MSVKTVILALALGLALAAVGCGSGSSRSEGAAKAKNAQSAEAGQDFDVSESEIGGDAAFRSGFNTCQLYPIGELARQNNVKAEPEAVATAVASIEPTAKQKKSVHDGCLKALLTIKAK